MVYIFYKYTDIKAMIKMVILEFQKDLYQELYNLMAPGIKDPR